MKYEIVNLKTWKRGRAFPILYRNLTQCHEYDGRYRCYCTHRICACTRLEILSRNDVGGDESDQSERRVQIRLGQRRESDPLGLYFSVLCGLS